MFDACVVGRGGFSPKIVGGGIARNRKKYELRIGLHLKSIISGVANSVMGQILRRP